MTEGKMIMRKKRKEFKLCYNSLLSLVGKDQKMRLLDPRVGESVTTFPVHDGRKGARVVWTKDLAITVGFSRMMEREIKLWDARHVEKVILIHFLL